VVRSTASWVGDHSQTTLWQTQICAASSFAWSGAQTLIAQLTQGDARYIGRFSFFARLGSTWR
jgi:hypothetical protein